MFKYFEPNKIFSITSRAPKYVLLLFIIIFSIGLTEALILSPEDYKQSHSVRNFKKDLFTLDILTQIIFIQKFKIFLIDFYI